MMYIVRTAARMRKSSLASEDSNAAAAPWKLVITLAGMPELRLGLADRRRPPRRASRPAER